MQKPRCAPVQDSHVRNKGPLLDEPRDPFIRTRTSNTEQEWGVSLLGAYLGGKRVGRSPVFSVGPSGGLWQPLQSGAFKQHYLP